MTYKRLRIVILYGALDAVTCQTYVTTALAAKKISSANADELNGLIAKRWEV